MNRKYILSIIFISTAVILLVAAFFLLRDKENIREYILLINPAQEKQYVALMFAGDIMLDRGIRYYAEQNGGNNFIFEKIKAALLANDLVVANLEGPITSNPSRSAGSKPGSTDNFFFTFDPSVAKTLYDHNIKLVDLGNNHIENFGKEGIDQTEKYLGQANVGFFGNPYGKKSIIKDIDGVKIAFVSYNQFVSDLPGEWEATTEEIEKMKTQADLVIVFCHWGVEYVKKATPEQIELGHRFIDAGADLVIGAHPHVIEETEEYKGKRIYYSLGNFIFDQYFSEDVREGLLVTVKINKKTKALEFSEQKTYLASGGQTILIDN